jgi:hypothetical protein
LSASWSADPPSKKELFLDTHLLQGCMQWQNDSKTPGSDWNSIQPAVQIIMTDLNFLKTEFLLNNINSVHISQKPVNAI